ncbi:MAG: sugar O-acetyltransferase [Edaphobacter sp.]|uniref:sugar O-acetyltransferase n=1 Tax=Edaphobacter sp. TaxID=1934404 RepID=UPI0023A5F3FC|nr:sugar O-acetyltransferase [Edaphobacter sp.]MDE1175929.1 sugar O-acetyltransferase [Edaphobacter sp.]
MRRVMEAAMTEKEKMLRGELYRGFDAELMQDRARSEALMLRMNAMPEGADRDAVMRELLGSAGEETIVRPPFFCDYGYNIHMGRGVFLNFNCVVLDVVEVRIGDGTQIGPAVQIYAADHPRDPELRRAGLENGRPVVIGKNVWIGGGAIILPGVTVGDDALIGAGSVVTKDVAAGATVAGNPARRLR